MSADRTRMLLTGLLGVVLIAVGLALDAELDAPLELLGEVLAALGGFCLALALFPKPRR